LFVIITLRRAVSAVYIVNVILGGFLNIILLLNITIILLWKKTVRTNYWESNAIFLVSSKKKKKNVLSNQIVCVKLIKKNVLSSIWGPDWLSLRITVVCSPRLLNFFNRNDIHRERYYSISFFTWRRAIIIKYYFKFMTHDVG